MQLPSYESRMYFTLFFIILIKMEMWHMSTPVWTQCHPQERTSWAMMENATRIVKEAPTLVSHRLDTLTSRSRRRTPIRFLSINEGEPNTSLRSKNCLTGANSVVRGAEYTVNGLFLLKKTSEKNLKNFSFSDQERNHWPRLFLVIVLTETDIKTTIRLLDDLP